MTNETKHTPGPWRIGARYGDLLTEVLSNDAVRGIAIVWTHVYNPADGKYRSASPHLQGQANLALIAAAPELKARVLSLENTVKAIRFYLDEPNEITVKRMKELCEQALYPKSPC